MNQDTRKHVLLYVLIIVLAIMLIVAFANIWKMNDEIGELNDEISHLTNTYNNRINAMNYEIAAIYDNVDEQLKKQASLFSSVDFSYGDFDPETSTAEINITVVPKSVTDDTQISVSLGDLASELVRGNNNNFSATVSVGLFEEYDVHPMATVTAGGESKTEYLENVYISYLWSEFLPTADASIEASESYSKGQVEIDGTLSVNCNRNYDGVWLEKVSLVTEINGNEVAREDMTNSLRTDGQAHIGNSSYSTLFNKTFSCTENDKIKFYIVAEDSAGYTHKSFAYGYYVADDAQSETIITEMSETIYDSQGNVVYGIMKK